MKYKITGWVLLVLSVALIILGLRANQLNIELRTMLVTLGFIMYAYAPFIFSIGWAKEYIANQLKEIVDILKEFNK